MKSTGNTADTTAKDEVPHRMSDGRIEASRRKSDRGTESYCRKSDRGTETSRRKSDRGTESDCRKSDRGTGRQGKTGTKNVEKLVRMECIRIIHIKHISFPISNIVGTVLLCISHTFYCQSRSSF